MWNRAIGSNVLAAGSPRRSSSRAIGKIYMSLSLVFLLSCQPPTPFDINSDDPAGPDRPRQLR